MTTLTRIIAASLGVLLMTAPNINQGDLELPAAIAEVPESSVIARIGQVVDIVESDNITVKISGSNVLVRASYLWPQFQPLLGDYVYVTKQDAQWAVLGTMSGPLNSVTPNASFEDGVLNATPDNWFPSVVSSTAGVPTFTKQEATPVSGRYIGVFRNSSAGVAGTSILDVLGQFVDAGPGERWALGTYLTYAAPDLNASLESQGGFLDISSYIRFYDVDNVLISESFVNYTPIYAGFTAPIFLRTATVPGSDAYVTSPPGTAAVRIRYRIRATMHTNSATELGIDAALLRRLMT